MALSGVVAITPTPFTPDGAVDLPGLPRLVERFSAWGVRGLVLLGLMGEAPALTSGERRQVIEGIVAAAAGRVPVVVGVSHAAARQAAALARQAEQLGAAAVMALAPSAPGFDRDEVVVDHFRALGDAVSIPLILQDYPPGSGTTLTPALLARLRQAVPQFQYLKLEDAPSPLKMARVREALGAGLPIFGGLGGLYFLEELMAGACGTMTGFAYPDALAAVYAAWDEGNPHAAARAFDRFLPLIRFEYQPQIGLLIRKEILRRRGALAAATARLPAAPLDPLVLTMLDDVLRRVGLDPGTGADLRLDPPEGL
jgi:4-hydroxy-tetrahydrodipicolinate synthase